MSVREARDADERRLVGASRRLLRLLSGHFLALELALAVALVAFVAVTTIVGNKGSIGGRYTRTTAISAVPLHRNVLASLNHESGSSRWIPYGDGSVVERAPDSTPDDAAVEVTASGERPQPYGVALRHRAKSAVGFAYTLSAQVRGDGTTVDKPVEVLLVARGGAAPEEVVARAERRLALPWRTVRARGRVRRGVWTEIAFYVIGRNDVALGDHFFVRRVALRRLPG